MLWLASWFQLLNDYLNDNELVKRILQNFALYFIPVANPDGYEFSRASKVQDLESKLFEQSPVLIVCYMFLDFISVQ